MTDLIKTPEAQKHRTSLGVSELIAAAAIVFLLIAVQGMFVAKHPVTLNTAAELAPYVVNGP